MSWHERPMTQKLATWFIFGVVIALPPFGFELLQLIDRGRAASMGEVLGTGQLLLVARRLLLVQWGTGHGRGPEQPPISQVGLNWRLRPSRTH